MHRQLLQLFLSFLHFNIVSSESTYPSIIWNPWNPLFACEEPRINVRLGDTLTFVCPTEEHTFYMPSSSVTILYENLYFLGTNKHAYHTCNATRGIKLLHCNGTRPIHKTITFRDFAISQNSLEFHQGGTYYLIGTGFRTKENLNNKINGSCSKTDHRGRFKLRLQIHVCEDEDTKCRICTTAGCYHRNCPTTQCGEWYGDKTVHRKSKPKKRNDENVTNEAKEMIHKDDVCFREEKRWCGNTLIPEVYAESRYLHTSCRDWDPTHPSSLVTSPCNTTVVSGDWEDHMVLGVAVGVVTALVVGMLVGVVLVRYRDKTKGLLNLIKQKKERENVAAKSISSFDNEVFAGEECRVTYTT